MDDWQSRDFALLDPALKRAAGRSDEAVRMRAYLERPRGHSKTADLAVVCTWALAFSTRPMRIYGYAADRDQAALLRDAMEKIVRLNPWLSSILSAKGGGIVNRASGHPGEGGTLTIVASDVGSSYGILPDLIVADELVHWQGDGALWNSLISSAAKRMNCLLVVISNAGFCDSWQWRIRETARTDEAWIFSRQNGPVASWLSADRLDEQKRMLPSIAYARLWLNEWSSGGGDALPPSQIDAAFDKTLVPMTGRERGWLFVGGVDLGLKRDASVVVVLGVRSGGKCGRIRLAHNRLWKPTDGEKVDLSEVEKTILTLDADYGLEQVAFDPWQMEHLAQRLEADTQHRRRNARRRFSLEPWLREVPPTGANLREMATLTIESFADRRLRLYDCEPLHRDLLKLRVVEKSYGFRLVSPRDETGHGDTFSAFALALLAAHDLAGRKGPFRIRSIVDPDPDDNLSPTQRLWERMQAEYDAERELLAQPDEIRDVTIRTLQW